MSCFHCKKKRSNSTRKRSEFSSEWDKSTLIDFNKQNAIQQLQLLPPELNRSLYEQYGTPVYLPGVKTTPQDFFLFKDIVGSGATAIVFQAEFRFTKETFAVKFIDDYREHRDVFQRELAVLRNFNDNIYLIQYHSSFRVHHSLYIITEFGDGGTLMSLVDPKYSLPATLLRVYIKEIASAIFYLHNNKILHRDISLQNVVLTKTAHCKLIDFGCCQRYNDQKGRLMTEIGHVAIRAPEVYLDKAYSYPVDYWSLGICLYRLFTGIFPFITGKLTESYQSVTKLQVKFPSWLDADHFALDLCKGLLIKDPMARLGTTSQAEIKNHLFFDNLNWSEVDSIELALFKDAQNSLQRYAHVISRMEKKFNFPSLDEYKAEIGRISRINQLHSMAKVMKDTITWQQVVFGPQRYSSEI